MISRPFYRAGTSGGCCAARRRGFFNYSATFFAAFFAVIAPVLRAGKGIGPPSHILRNSMT